MVSDQAKSSFKRSGKPAKRRPLDDASLRDLALSYAARYATTGAKVESYLARKIRERGVAEDSDGRTQELDVTGLVTRLIELGYVDDAAYARMRSRDLASRGYGARRVEQALWAAGVEEDVRQENAPSTAQARKAAVLLARKRRFGPYARLADGEELDRAVRDKQISAMLRAGHNFETARFITGSHSIDDVEQWLIEAEDEENDDQGEGLQW